MFTSVPTRGSPGLRSPVMPFVASPQEDDDNISLTSTVPDNHDSDEEFEVKTIHLENLAEDGSEMMYLVEWEDYPLHQCTWEPASNIGHELRQMWEEKKERQRRGEEEAWTWDTWRGIANAAVEEHEARHRRRNARRKKLGLPLTEPIGEEERKSPSSDDDWSAEAEEDGRFDAKIPGTRPSKPQRNRATATTAAKPGSARSKPPKSPSDPVPRPALARRVSKESAPTSRAERPSTTGYQGTARRPSNPGPNTATAGARSTQSGPGKSGPVKRLTAKKSATVPGVSNVFVGGKVRKTRVGLKDAMSDPTKDPKLFTKYRIRRLAEKSSRDKEDRPPPISPSLFTNLAVPLRRKSSMPEAVATAPAAQSTMAPPAATKKPKKKSVRFHDDEPSMFVDEPMPMEVDSHVAPATEEQPGLIAGRGVPSRSVKTGLWFGFVPDSEPILADLDGIPSTSDDPWLSDFLKTDVLRIEYTCFVQDFAFQKQHIWSHLLCFGTVSSGSSGPILENVDAYLRDTMLGLYRSAPSYNLILYPTSCDLWRSFMAEQGVAPSGEAGGGLKYCIFRSPVDCGLFLRRPTMKGPGPSFGSYEEKLMWRLFKFDYQSLIPSAKPGFGMKETSHPCFLLFPRHKGEMLAVIARWIRQCRPDCQIYTSYDAGAWSSFCNDPDSGSGGIVIVHELLSLSLHRIPDLWRRLHHSLENYWCLSEAIQPQPIFPSLTQPGEVVQPGEIRLTPLFPTKPRRRLAVLLTPSFLSSEAQRVYELLEWFYTHFVIPARPRVKLVTACNLHEYLEELALQKADERDRLLKQYKHNVLEAEIAASVRGLSHEDCAFRFKACAIALELHQIRAEISGPSAVNEDLSCLIYADPCIDPNDEQSLVNWFGWWSSMRLDQFRGFHVVGSSVAIKHDGNLKGSRVIRVPTYSRLTINDPDLVREEVQQMNEQADASKGPDQTEGNDAKDGPAAPAGPPRPWVFQSKRIASETSPNFKEELARMRPTRAITLYLYPVSWTEPGMSFHFGDVREEFNSLPRWWSFAWAFMSGKPFNTYIGFFYTLTEEWNPDAPPDSRTPVRHPWICVYRIVSGSRNPPVGACELVIWDPAAPDRFPGGRTPREEELAPGQRKVIEFVREKTAEKNPGSWLEYVWYGGFERPPNADSPYPVDLTLAYLELVTRDTYKYLPLWDRNLLPAGFRKVVLKGSLPNPSPSSEPMDVDTPLGRPAEDADGDGDEDEDVDARIIFHPPRGSRPTGGRTRCINRLYERVGAARREARASGRERTHMRYDFPVTTDWYEVQRAEGRGFEHVHVAPWEAMFNLLQVQTSAAAAAAEKAANGAGSPAMG